MATNAFSMLPIMHDKDIFNFAKDMIMSTM
jgi:hypothetical protein